MKVQWQVRNDQIIGDFDIRRLRRNVASLQALFSRKV